MSSAPSLQRVPSLLAGPGGASEESIAAMTMWVNEQLEKGGHATIEDMFEELKTGVVLQQLYEVLYRTKMKPLKASNHAAKCRANIEVMLKAYAEDSRLRMSTLTADDFYPPVNKAQMSSFFWQLIATFDPTAKSGMREWQMIMVEKKKQQQSEGAPAVVAAPAVEVDLEAEEAALQRDILHVAAEVAEEKVEQAEDEAAIAAAAALAAEEEAVAAAAAAAERRRTAEAEAAKLAAEEADKARAAAVEKQANAEAAARDAEEAKVRLMPA